MEAEPAFPLTPYPRGWYFAAYSDELAIGDVKPLHFFGRELAIFRTEDGRPHVVDAHCPHLGAHFGHGGEVRGGCLRCPFHGWEFEADSGACVQIANGDAPPAKARLRRWEVDEVNGMVLFWFHERGEAPDWRVQPLPDLAGPGWSRWSPTSWVLNARIQDVSENDADVSHSPVMHGFTVGVPSIAMDAEGARCTWHLTTEVKLASIGVPKIPRIGPFAPPQSAPSEIEVLRWGMCVGWIRQWVTLPFGLSFATQSLATTTPIDEDHVLLTFRHRVRKAPIPGLTEVMLRSYAKLFDSTAQEDVRIWENKIYRMRPAASKSDWAILAFRRWAKQFYDPAHFDAAMGRGVEAPAAE
ncbi:MAG: Rieske 2Fe-2S domain-containing protein [Nannocystaceae bacterium]